MGTHFIKKMGRIFCGISFLMFFLPAGGYADYLYDGLKFAPSASVQEGYDDNVTYVKNDPISDAVTQLSAGLGIKREDTTETLSLDTRVEEELFAQHSSFDNTSEYADLLVDKEFTDTDKLKVTDVFSHSVEPTSFENAFGSTAGRYFTYLNTVSLGYRHDLNDQLAVNFNYINDLSDFTSVNLSDSSLNTVGTGLAYALDPQTTLKTDYDYKYRDFYPGSSAVENEVSAGVKHFLTPEVFVDLGSGVDFINSFNGQDYIQPLYDASLNKILDEKTQVGISFSKEYTTNGYVQDLFNAWQVSADYIKNLTSKITAIVDVFYGSGDYISTSIQEKYTGASISASYDLTHNTKLTLSYSFSRDDSTLPTDNYAKNVVYLGASYKF